TLKFSVKEKQYLKIVLFDLQGRLIKIIVSQNFNEGDQTFQVSTSDLSSGAYLVCIRNKYNATISSVKLSVD
ncbi:MAG: T9SS type A sorting domain-containing protein, partial [Bacteroidetes bacterium]|nr:T9SS type A sorting domain-containing protein [Bacteroidota bacterium]